MLRVMALFGSLFALLGRFAGKILNTALGWATVLLFGRVEGSKQILLLLIALGALLWAAALAGVVFPDVGAVLIGFIPVPDFIDETWVRIAMLIAAIVIPLAVGVAAVLLTEKERRPGGVGLLGAVLRGYPFCLVLALTIAILAVAGLVRKVRSLARRWEDQHVPIIVQPGGYERVLEALRDVLERSGFAPRVEAAPRVLSIPPKLLDAVAGRALGGLVPDRLAMLEAPDLEVLVYPSDVVVSGQRDAVAHARAAIASRLTHAPAYLTASREGQEIEDALRRLSEGQQPGRRRDPAAVQAVIAPIDERLAKIVVPFDEWETLYRQRLQVERDALAAAAESSRLTRGSERRSDPTPLGRAAAALGLGLAAANLLVGLLDRVPKRWSNRH